MALLNGDERATLRAAQAGSQPAFETLFRSTWPRAFRASYLIVLDHPAAEELVLESFLGLVRALDGFGEEQPLSPWLHRLVVNRSIDRARARALQPSGLRHGVEETTASLDWALPVGGPHLDRAALELAAGLRSLSPDLRAVLVLRFLLDYSPGEAAEILGIPRATVNARLERAVAHLRQRLQGETSIDEKSLRTLLLQQPVPGEHLAIERTWGIVVAAYGMREHALPRRRVPVRLLGLAAVLVAAGLAVWLTPAGDWIADRIGGGEEAPAEAVETILVAPQAALPADGRLLLASDGEVVVLDRDGTETPLGSYAAASWSPDGRFVAAWRRGTLVGLDVAEPETILWELDRRRVADARWSPDGFRVAYRTRRALRVVDGSGTDDHRVATRVAPVAPAWAPGEEHVLAYADLRGRVRVIDADSGEVRWQLAAGGAIGLDWTASGRLAVLTGDRLLVLSGPQRIVYAHDLPTGGNGTAVAARPGSDEVAFSVLDPATRTSSVYLAGGNGETPRLLFAGSGPLPKLVWSPDGSYLLVPWREADQWLFVPVERGAFQALADAQEALGRDAFPRVEGWCCAPQAD